MHGIAIKEFKVVKSFGRIGKKLEEAGHCVYASDTDGFGTIEHNAEQLKAQIERILEKEHAEKVNILAHSKGGLDSKYMISRLGMEDRVASLTTLSTPHRGSKLATWIFHMPRWISKFIAFWVNLWYRIFGDRKPDALTVCKQLQATPNDDIDGLTVPDSIFCQSFSGTMNRSRDDFLMSIPFLFTRRLEKAPSDGLVAVESTKFGNYRGDCIEGPLSHTEMVGYALRKKKRERVYAFYLDLAEQLAQMGL